MFNIRFKVEDIKLFGLIEFSENEKPPTPYYNLADKVDEPKFTLSLAKGNLIFNEQNERRVKQKIGKSFTESYKEFDNIHGLIQEQLVAFLRQQYKKDKVNFECKKEGCGTRIDIVRLTAQGKTIFYEIKSYPSVLYSIRVAIGQLFEYSFYPGLSLADEFVIVTHLQAEPIELEYLKYLSSKLGLQIGYIHFKPIIPISTEEKKS